MFRRIVTHHASCIMSYITDNGIRVFPTYIVYTWTNLNPQKLLCHVVSTRLYEGTHYFHFWSFFPRKERHRRQAFTSSIQYFLMHSSPRLWGMVKMHFLKYTLLETH